MKRRNKPRAGDVWFNHNDYHKEIIVLLHLGEGWELLVTRQDGTTYIDWEYPNRVHDWYLTAQYEDSSGLTRVI